MQCMKGGVNVSAKPIRYTEKVAVSFTPEQLQQLKEIAERTGDTVSGILRRLAIQFIDDNK